MPSTSERAIALAFDSHLLAQEALLAARRLEEDGLIALHDAVVITRPDRSPAHVVETTDPTPVAAAVPSSLGGAIVGTLVAGPLGVLIGGVVAGAGGAVAAKLIDTGISDRTIAQLRRLAAPGQSILVLLFDDVAPFEVLTELHRFSGARLVYTTLPPAGVEAVRQALAA